MTEEVLEAVDHRQYVWTLPGSCARPFEKSASCWAASVAVPGSACANTPRRRSGEGFVPGAVVAIQTYGDALNPHEHIHMLASDSAWRPDGVAARWMRWILRSSPASFNIRSWRQWWPSVVSVTTLPRKLRAWHPSGFGVYRGRPIDPDDRPRSGASGRLPPPSQFRRQPTALRPRAGSDRIPHPPKASAAPWMPWTGSPW